MKKFLFALFIINISYSLHASGDANVTISTGTTLNGSWSGSTTMTFTPNANDAVVKISEITGYLTSGKNVTILTSCSGSGSQSGDVTISGTITAAMTSSNKTFTITAAGTITVNSVINLSGASGGTTGYSGGKINFTSSGGAVAINNTITTSGNAASLAAYGSGGVGGSVTISGTSVSMTGGSGIITTGGTGRGSGGAGGAVTITATSTSINITKNITTTGGSTGTAVDGASGGNGGVVNITANTSLTVANITARGGNNSHWSSCQGSGANVNLDGSSITKGTVNTTQGSSALGVASCGSKTDGTLSETIIPLPVELLNFSAFKEDEHIFITWETAAEINNDYFIVEKSIDGNNWEQITKVSGAGNSFVPITYSIIDPNGCNGNCYYRLKQIDFDGTQTTYKAVLLQGKTQNTKLEVNVYPNPTYDFVDISLLIQENESYTIILTNTLGEIIHKREKKLVKGLNYMHISLTNYLKGSYYLQVYSDSQLLTTLPVIKL